jgi:hypothetical protein
MQLFRVNKGRMCEASVALVHFTSDFCLSVWLHDVSQIISDLFTGSLCYFNFKFATFTQKAHK